MATLNAISKWDDEADVVILGFGLAGAVTAMTAHDEDASCDVLIVEKMPQHLAGGNSRVSGQSLHAPHDVAKAATYQRAMNEPNPIPEEMLQMWAEHMVQLEPWMERMAAEVGGIYDKEAIRKIVDMPEFPCADVVEYTSTMLPNPSGVWNVFRKHVERRPRIRQRYESRAVDLVQDPDSLEVLGVLVMQAGKKVAIKARRAVAMCTGGFENDLQMQRDYFGLEYVRTFGTPGNTGDGLRMLQKAGAEMWHLRGRNQAGGFWPGFESPDRKLFMARNVRLTAGSWIDIGRDNKRIFDESFEYRLNHYRQKVHGHWVDAPHAFALPVHMIFDEAQRKRECLAAHTMGWSAIVDKYVWSEDNSAEVEKGWILRAGSIRELAALIKRDPDAVEAEVARYNGFCATGRDLDYGRKPESMQPIAKPPYYALAITPGIVCSTGGARRDQKSRVLSQQGSPIPRLYEVGELGSTFSNLYQTGCFLTECMVFGRIAGHDAVRLKPQSG